MHKNKQGTIKTIQKIAPSILIALTATGLGFLSLYVSPVPMIQDFGKMLTVGMIISFVVALLFLIPVLFIRDHYFLTEHTVKKHMKNRKLEKWLQKGTKGILSYKWFILSIAIITASIGFILDLKSDVDTDIENFMPQETQELKDIHHLREIVGTTDQVSILITNDYLLKEETLNYIEYISTSLPERFDEVVQTKSIATILNLNPNQPSTIVEKIQVISQIPDNQRKLFLNDELNQSVIIVGIKHLEANDLKSFIEDLENYIENNKIKDLEVTITGKSVIDVEMVSALTTGRYTITLFGLAAVFLGLLLIYRNPLKALIPLLPISLIVGWSGGIMYLLNIKYTPLTSTLGALIIGIGTEFTILILQRYQEEQKDKSKKEDAIIYTMRKIGKPILASALTTIAGFSALIISDFIILRNFGIMTVINISLALISSLVVMPILLLSLRNPKFKS